MSAKNTYNYKHKSFHSVQKDSYNLKAGLSGFLCTCNSKLTERDCIRESYNILNEFADKIFGCEKDALLDKNDEKCEKPENIDEDEDIGDSLKREVDSIRTEINKKPENRRFQVIKSGATGIVFIRTLVPDPVKLAHTIISSQSEIPKSKYLLRLLPVEITCKAYVKDICSACDSLFDRYFSGTEKTFAVVYNHRNNNQINREELIHKVAELVVKRNDKHKADLKNPQLAVLLEVIRSICCISVLPDFYTYKKYNLMELAIQRKSSSDNVNEKGEPSATMETPDEEVKS